MQRSMSELSERIVFEWLAALSQTDPNAANSDRASDTLDDAVLFFRKVLAQNGYPGNDPATAVSDITFGRSLARALRTAGVGPSGVLESLVELRDVLNARDFSSLSGSLASSQIDDRLLTVFAACAQAFSEDQAKTRRDLSGTLDVFTRTLAHELKNPIAAADGAAALLMDETISSDPAQRARFAEIVARNLKRATELINDLRALVNASRGEETISRPRPLAGVIEDALHETAAAATENGVVVSVVEPVPEAQVDSARATLVLMNLVWNAIKYCDPQKAVRWVRIGASRTGEGDWHCYVTDNGVGIADDDQERIFERFERAHEGLAEGTGLGLAIAQEAVTQLGGRIWLDSREGLGTTFHFTLPELHQ